MLPVFEGCLQAYIPMVGLPATFRVFSSEYDAFTKESPIRDSTRHGSY
jgi:hypothetical protein